MNIQKDIPELIEAGVLSEETAGKIQAYYAAKNDKTPNKLLLSFGILGSLLIGLGIILMLAHNWDELSNLLKTILAFIPLLIGQATCVYVYFKKRDNQAWSESSSTFLVIAIAACISLISQIYNIAGDLPSFILTWILLSLPLVYILRSSMVSLFFIVGSSYYHLYCNYFHSNTQNNYIYFLLISLLVPHYILLIKENSKNSFIAFHHWLLCISLSSALGVFIQVNAELGLIIYSSWFACLFFIGSRINFDQKKLISNAFKILSSLATLVILYSLSFKFFWLDLHKATYQFKEFKHFSELITAGILTLAALLFLITQRMKADWRKSSPMEYLFIFILGIFVIGHYSSSAQILVNILLFSTGVYTIWEGSQKKHLGQINYGLLILSILIICRFFDSNWSFVFRGLLFILVGIGFLASNIFILRSRKEIEK